MIDRLFFEHPRAIGETYGKHLMVAGSFGFTMIAGGCACLVHAIFPRLFTATGSGTVLRLHRRMILDRAGTETAAVIIPAPLPDRRRSAVR